MPSSRRSFLAALSGAAALSGCTVPGTRRASLECGSVESAWPMAGRDRRRSGSVPDATLPGDEAEGVSLTGGHGALDGGARAAPAVVDGAAVIGTATDRIAALDPDGSRRWTVRTENAVRTTPAVTCGHVYVASANATHAIDPADGSVRWRSGVPGVLDPSASPVAAGRTVYVPSPGGVHALDATDGSERWRAGVEESPNGVAVDGAGAYVTASGNGAGSVYGFSPRGEERWRLAPGRVLAAPTVSDGRVFAVTDGGRVLAVEAESGVVRWTAQVDDGVHEGLAVAGGTVYAPAGNGEHFYAIDAEAGEVRWRFRTGVSSSAPVVAGDRVLAVGANTGVHVLDARTGERRRVYARGDLGLGIVGSSLAVGAGSLYYVEGTASNVARIG